jgi:hypothetical protein
MSKFVNGWRAGQADGDIYNLPSDEMVKIAKQAYEIEVLRNRCKSLGQSRDVWKRKAKKLDAENKLLREPFVAAMTVAQEQNERQ